MSDLSKTHCLITDLFTTDPSSASPLSDQQLHDFSRDGYVAGPTVLSERQLDVLRRELAEMTQPDHSGRNHWYEYHSNESANPDTVLFHALGAWRVRPGFHDALWNASVVVPAEQLLEGPVRFWHDQLFCKPAEHGGVVAWHQDYSYWTRTTPMNHLTCWIALDDATTDNGCIQYIPGSHRWELLPITGLAGDMQAIEGVLNEEQIERFRQPVAMELKAGQCVFHHPLTIHGSFENRTKGPRRAFVMNLIRDGVTSASDQPLLEGVDVIQPGEPLAGRFFPLLSQKS